MNTKLTNAKTYVASHSLCREFSSPMVIWFYLREIRPTKFRIKSHQYMGREMFWDGRGVEPLIIGAPSIGDRWVRADVIDSINRAWAERCSRAVLVN